MRSATRAVTVAMRQTGDRRRRCAGTRGYARNFVWVTTFTRGEGVSGHICVSGAVAALSVRATPSRKCAGMCVRTRRCAHYMYECTRGFLQPRTVINSKSYAKILFGRGGVWWSLTVYVDCVGAVSETANDAPKSVVECDVVMDREVVGLSSGLSNSIEPTPSTSTCSLRGT